EQYGPDYDRAATRYLSDVALNFPADMIVRVFAATLKVLTLPYNKTSLQPLPFVSNGWIQRMYRLRETALRMLGAAWPWAIGAALVGLSVSAARLSVFVLLIMVYYASYPVLQFNER